MHKSKTKKTCWTDVLDKAISGIFDWEKTHTHKQTNKLHWLTERDGGYARLVVSIDTRQKLAQDKIYTKMTTVSGLDV